MLHKIDPQLLDLVQTQKTENSLVECIVYANHYGNTKQFLLHNLKAQHIAEYPFILAFGIQAPAKDLPLLAKRSEVSYISSNYKVTTLLNVSKKVLGLESKVWLQAKQPKFTVAVIDTGVQPIADLCIPQNRLVHFEDFVNQKTAPYDDNGHGTFVASVIAGNGLVSGGKFSGMHPDANIIALKALDENGETGAMTILQAMQWVYDNKRKYHIKVVCMSFGSGTMGKRDPLIIGAEVLWNAGICVVSAAGNSGPQEETIKSPGASNRIITVGALNDNRDKNGEVEYGKFEVADFSSRGPVFGNYKPDLLAPGVNIVGACNFPLLGQHYRQMSGTSVATPMVAGVCSLLYSQNLFYTPNEIKRLLLKNCNPIDFNKNNEGFGVLNCRFLEGQQKS